MGEELLDGHRQVGYEPGRERERAGARQYSTLRTLSVSSVVSYPPGRDETIRSYRAIWLKKWRRT